MRACTKCGIAKPVSDFHKDGNAIGGISRRCKDCARANARKWNADNSERKTKARKAYYSIEENRGQKQQYDRRYRAENIEAKRELNRSYSVRNSAAIVDRVRKWRIANPERNAAQKRKDTATRRAIIKRACPSWADHRKIAEVYVLADRLTRETGIPHDVDHIYPLAGRISCGLHVHQNLRAIPATDNRKKSRKENYEWLDISIG